MSYKHTACGAPGQQSGPLTRGWLFPEEQMHARGQLWKTGLRKKLNTKLGERREGQTQEVQWTTAVTSLTGISLWQKFKPTMSTYKQSLFITGMYLTATEWFLEELVMTMHFHKQGSGPPALPLFPHIPTVPICFELWACTKAPPSTGFSPRIPWTPALKGLQPEQATKQELFLIFPGRKVCRDFDNGFNKTTGTIFLVKLTKNYLKSLHFGCLKQNCFQLL